VLGRRIAGSKAYVEARESLTLRIPYIFICVSHKYVIFQENETGRRVRRTGRFQAGSKNGMRDGNRVFYIFIIHKLFSYSKTLHNFLFFVCTVHISMDFTLDPETHRIRRDYERGLEELVLDTEDDLFEYTGSAGGTASGQDDQRSTTTGSSQIPRPLGASTQTIEDDRIPRAVAMSEPAAGAVGPIIQPPNRRGFHCAARGLLLTYSQCPHSQWTLIREACLRTHHEHCLVGFELHQDGSQHIHVACFSDVAVRVDSAGAWDVTDDSQRPPIRHHPNVKLVYSPPGAVRYVAKDGKFEICTGSPAWKSAFENWIGGGDAPRPVPIRQRDRSDGTTAALGKRLLDGEPLEHIVRERPSLIIQRNLDQIRRNLELVRTPQLDDGKTIEKFEVGPFSHYFSPTVRLRCGVGTVDGRENTHVFLYGPPKCGKSYAIEALERCGARIYRRNRFNNWANYDSINYDVIVSDDFNSSSVPEDAMGELLQCLDGKPTYPNNKGGVGHHRSLKLFIFASNSTPDALDTTSIWHAFFTRMTCYQFTPGSERSRPWEGASVSRHTIE